MEDQKRSAKFKKNNSLEFLLNEINSVIENGNQLHKVNSLENAEVVFIIGAPRSGTTLLFQLLANSGAFTYPTNLVSRFYANPRFGLLVQDLIFNKKFHHSTEFIDVNSKEKFEFISSLGKTEGIYAPNEFWYFWRRYFDDSKMNVDLKFTGDVDQLNKELNLMYDYSRKPLLFKGLMFNEYVDLILELIPNSKFIYINRDLHDNSKSLLGARRKFFGGTSEWYSFKTQDFDDIIKLEPVEQVVRQISRINNKINQFKENYGSRILEVLYTDLCSSPLDSINQIMSFIDLPNVSLNLDSVIKETSDSSSRDLEILQAISKQNKMIE